MTKKLLDKLGYNVFHDDYTGKYPWSTHNFERGLEFAVKAGVKYLRPAFNLQADEFNGTDNPWRLEAYHRIQDLGMIGIVCAYPQQIRNHILDDDADDLLTKGVNAYAHIMDRFLEDGITSFILEGWNETDGNFAINNQQIAQNNDEVIDRYLNFNMRLCEEAHKRNVKFIDLCSIRHPGAPELKHVIDCYNQKMSQYSSKPEWISFHPYCERNRSDNVIPELYLGNFSLSNWENLSDIPIAVTEFGFPSSEWGKPFSGKYPFQYARDMLIRQIIIQDYLGIDPILIYSANTNADPSVADKDDCWGTFQNNAHDNLVEMSELGKVELSFLQSMKGYWLSNAILIPETYSPIHFQYSNYAFEYTNDEGHKKLFYWNPFGFNTTSLNWNNQTYNLTFTQHVKSIES